MSVTPYDSYQQVFALSMLSNRASAFTGPASDLQQQLLYELSPYLTMPSWVTPVANMTPAFYSAPMSDAVAQLGSWTLEWGPAIYQAPSAQDRIAVADNAIFVASNTSFIWPDGKPRKVYVVATAATNPGSEYDWVDEDGSVNSVVEFATYSITKGHTITFNPSNLTPVDKTALLPWNSYISLATATGVSNLLGLTASVNNTTLTLQQFLSGISTSSPTGLIFTGHSLAGALSPTLAFYLQSQLTNFSLSNNQILVYPTAGATPGSLSFSNFFNEKFAAQPTGSLPYQQWNTDLWNYYDVVPHAWGTPPLYSGPNNLSAIPTLYGTPALSYIQDFVTAAQTASTTSLVAYTPLRNSPLNSATPSSLQPCTIYAASSKSPTPPPFPQPGWDATPGGPILAAGAQNYGDYDFLLQLAVQHIGMYSGIPSVIYYPAGSTTAAIQPAVQGLILSSMITPVPQKLGVVSGLTVLTPQEMLTDVMTWLAEWIGNHVLAAK